MKNTFVSILILIFVAFLFGFESYHTTCGRVGLTRKNGNGCICHNEFSNENVYVGVSGSDTIIAGTSTIFTAFIFGGPDSTGGINTAVNFGTLHKIDSTLCEIDSELTYSFPHPIPIDGVTMWNFLYTAPNQVCVDTIYSVGVSVNKDSLPTGDMWNFGENFPVHIIEPNNVKENFVERKKIVLLPNYPNPFNPKTKISFYLTSSQNVSLKVYDISGHEVKTLIENTKMEIGNHEIEFDGNNLQSGTYFVKLVSKNSLLTQKIILLK